MAVNSVQVEMEEQFFVLHKSILEKRFETSQGSDALKPENYEVIINPFIEYKSVETNEDFEYNISFPQLKSVISRPNIIRVRYTNGEMEYVSKMLFGVQARMFMNQWDMIMGKSIIWWYRTLGRVFVRSQYRKSFPHLIYSAENVSFVMRKS